MILVTKLSWPMRMPAWLWMRMHMGARQKSPGDEADLLVTEYQERFGAGQILKPLDFLVRYLAAQWSPGSRFLAVTDHVDGHISDVSIHRVTATASPEGVRIELRDQTPEPGTYDTKWEVAGWNIEGGLY